MSLENIIHLVLLGIYTLYLILYAILTFIFYRKKQDNKKDKRYIQDMMLADMLEKGVDIPKEEIVKILRMEQKPIQPLLKGENITQKICHGKIDKLG